MTALEPVQHFTGAPPNAWLRRRWHVDRVVATAALVVASPVLAGLITAIRTHDPGPGMVRMPRGGQHGETFRVWKLRSMRVVQADSERSLVTFKNDRRVTPLGKYLRKWHIDELPQLLNVVIGDMALFGPRPETPELVDMSDPAWRAVLAARPGLAGPTQVIVRAWEAQLPPESMDLYLKVLLPAKLEIDQWYLAHASPLIDVLVVLSLLEQFARPEARTRLHAIIERELPHIASLGRQLIGDPPIAVEP